MNISEAARYTGLSAKTLRYYEKIGLISPAPRSKSHYRIYAEQHLQQLRFIRQAKDLGFSLQECKELLALYNNANRKSADVRALVMDKINIINEKVDLLQQLRNHLETLMAACQGNEHPECAILNTLASMPVPEKA